TARTGGASGWTVSEMKAGVQRPAPSVAVAVRVTACVLATDGTASGTVTKAAGFVTVAVEAPKVTVRLATDTSSLDATLTDSVDPERTTVPAAGDWIETDGAWLGTTVSDTLAETAWPVVSVAVAVRASDCDIATAG